MAEAGSSFAELSKLRGGAVDQAEPAPIEPKIDAKGRSYATGRRKDAVARVWVKPGKGAFYATGLHELLQARGITHLIFGGVTTEVCVQTSMREANDRGYDCLLLEDCTESYFPQFKAATVEMIRAQGAIVGWTSTGAALRAALAEPLAA